MPTERPFDQQQVVVYQKSTPHPVYWVIAISLAIIALTLVTGREPLGPSAALAQSSRGAGAGGLFAFGSQMTDETYGLYMVDVDKMTIWAYENVPRQGLRLISARTWKYDRYLENYSTIGDSPEKIEELVEEQRKYRLSDSGDLDGIDH